jgi:hypothetical protein
LRLRLSANERNRDGDGGYGSGVSAVHSASPNMRVIVIFFENCLTRCVGSIVSMQFAESVADLPQKDAV